MKYQNCQFENRCEAEFRGDCGKPLRQEIVCPRCSTTSSSDRKFCDRCGQPLTEQALTSPKPKKPSIIKPTSFTDGRYQVKKFLADGSKKKGYLAHYSLLDRDVAFTIIKTRKSNDNVRNLYSII